MWFLKKCQIYLKSFRYFAMSEDIKQLSNFSRMKWLIWSHALSFYISSKLVAPQTRYQALLSHSGRLRSIGFQPCFVCGLAWS